MADKKLPVQEISIGPLGGRTEAQITVQGVSAGWLTSLIIKRLVTAGYDRCMDCGEYHNNAARVCRNCQ